MPDFVSGLAPQSKTRSQVIEGCDCLPKTQDSANTKVDV
jgi:hypothetical protein